MAFPFVGLLYLAAGAVTWLRRPGNGTGALLCWCALAVLAAAAGNTTIPALGGVGLITTELPIGILIHLLLAFPSGRLPDARSRWLAGGGYAVTVGLQAPRYLFAGPVLPSPQFREATRWPSRPTRALCSPTAATGPSPTPSRG